jgi:histidyl-tRNA synthetase
MIKAMSNTNLQTPKGFRDFLPEKMAIRNEVIKRLRSVFEKYGFSELQTPSLEYQEVLLGKYGKEAEKLMYLFEDPGKRKVGLRYDLTVPMARVASAYQDLPKPFKRYQIQPAWRAENTQKGRYREFFQCDVDTVGSKSPIADAEILAVISDCLSALGFSAYEIKVNSRAILFSIMDKAGIAKGQQLSVIQSIDKLSKKSKEEVISELKNKDVGEKQIDLVFSEIAKAKPDEYLAKVISLAEEMGAKKIVFDPTISRGLDYYTGPIFESVVEEPKIGSITGGGRYDGLLKTLGGPDLPAVGTTIGLDRVCDVIEKLGLWKDSVNPFVKVLVTVFSPDLLPLSLSVAGKLRSFNINTELFVSDETPLDKQLKYADKKNVPFVIILGPDEAKENLITLKNLKTKSQEKITLDEVIAKLK